MVELDGAVFELFLSVYRFFPQALFRLRLDRSRNMRIGIDGLSLLFQRTGISTYTNELVANLRGLDFNDSVILFARNQRFGRSSYHSIPYRERIANYLYKEYQLPKKLAGIGVDIYHSPQGMGLPSSSHLHCPCLMTLHDIILVSLASDYYSSVWAKVFERRLRHKVESADHIITISKYSRSEILDWSGIDPSNVSVIYLGVSGRFRPVTDPQVVERVRHRYRLPERFILYIGSTEPRKNMRRAVEAFNLFKKKHANYHLVVAGVSYRYISLQKAFEGLNLERVLWAGYVEDLDLPSLYTMADLLFFPSLCEGFGLPPLEAMACGTPVVTSDKTSIPEIVGDAAILINPHEPKHMADALEKVLSSKSTRRMLIKNGKKHASNFDWEKTAKQTRELYARIIDQG